ncbi:shieldin complex subunit 2 isoform X2 [Mastacembelus armatus]|nr:shieldin complex subunit 2 isoform X2 [Mastacembelus armatus]XP_026165131.1 shieldin complex subunit 2 isoform X2 [Mastacembelus armatus]
MCDRPKIHVFLGAPPPSSCPPSVTGPRLDGEDRPPAGWRHLELTWTDGYLRPTREQEGPGVLVCSDDHSPTDEPGPEKEDPCSSSIQEYLESCFPAASPGKPELNPEPNLELNLEPHPESHHKPDAPHCSEPCPAIPPLSANTQYLATWTLSQALVLTRRRVVQSATSSEKTPSPQIPPTHVQTPPSCSPELFSPETVSIEASIELFSQSSPTPQAKKGGVILQATNDGVLCSQESMPTADSPTKPPSLKKCKESRTEVAEQGSSSTVTTLLTRCDKRGLRYSVLVAVIHPCHLKEVKVKSGPSAGTFVPLASVVVTDQSAVEMKVVLWRRAAFWALTVSPGDVLLITGLQVSEDRWRGETLLQSTFSSKLLNLGQISTCTSAPAPQHVNARSLSSLCGFLRERRPLLASLPSCPLQDLNRLPYASLRSLRVNTLVHALLRVVHTHISTEWRSEAQSRCRSAVQLKAVVTVQQADGQQGVLLLWGTAVDWLPRFSANRAAVWDFHILLVREGLTSDLLELHSTPWSSVRPLDPTDRRAQVFHRPRSVRSGEASTVELDLDTLLSQKYSGNVELRVEVTAFHFQDVPHSQSAPQPVLDSSTPLAGIVETLNGDVTYTGCGRCAAELETDSNGIYCPCYPCLPHTAVRRYYRPGVLTVSGRGSRQVYVQVPPVPLQKILDAPPDKLHRSSAPGSEVKHIQVAADRIHSLLSLPRKTVIITIRSHFLCDENSVPIDQDLTLLDLQLPSRLNPLT